MTSWKWLAAGLPLAQQTSGSGSGGWDGMFSALVMFVPLIIIFWLLIWRPESKRRKEHAEMLNSLKKNDRVICSGICGTVAEVEKDEVVVLVDPDRKIKLRFRREAIQYREAAKE